jgi:hypothetical protein
LDARGRELAVFARSEGGICRNLACLTWFFLVSPQFDEFFVNQSIGKSLPIDRKEHAPKRDLAKTIPLFDGNASNEIQ